MRLPVTERRGRTRREGAAKDAGETGRGGESEAYSTSGFSGAEGCAFVRRERLAERRIGRERGKGWLFSKHRRVLYVWSVSFCVVLVAVAPDHPGSPAAIAAPTAAAADPGDATSDPNL